MQARQRPARYQEPGSWDHESRALAAEKSPRAYPGADPFVADGNKGKALVLGDSLLHPIKPVIRQYSHQVHAGRFESSDNSLACLDIHGSSPLVLCTNPIGIQKRRAFVIEKSTTASGSRGLSVKPRSRALSITSFILSRSTIPLGLREGTSLR